MKRVLVAFFLLAVFMGAGPGLYLINPEPGDPNTAFIILGLPKVYVWGLFWYVVQFAVIVIAYRRFWVDSDD